MSASQVTLARVWAALSLWSRVRLLWSVLGTGIFMPDPEEMRDLIEGLKEADVMTEVRLQNPQNPHHSRAFKGMGPPCIARWLRASRRPMS